MPLACSTTEARRMFLLSYPSCCMAASLACSVFSGLVFWKMLGAGEERDATELDVCRPARHEHPPGLAMFLLNGDIHVSTNSIVTARN